MSVSKDFVHLHLHTQYSLLDGAILVNDLMDKLKKQNVGMCGISDHGTMYGIVDFYRTALKNEIKPILGCVVYVAPDDMTNRSYGPEDDKNYHLVLLAKNNKGLLNLQHLVSRAQLEGFYYKPRIDKKLLERYSEGIIGLSACLAGEIPRKIIKHNNYDAAVEAAIQYRDILGKDDFFLEVQDNGIDDQIIANRNIFQMSKETGIPLVATNDCHYLNKGDHISHEVLMCIQMQTTMNDPNRMLGHGDQLWVKSPEEMWAAFGDYPDALTNTVAIAERCNTSITFGDLHLPQYDVPEGYTIESYFEHLCRVGLHEKLAALPESVHQEYHDRLDEELNIIIMKGFPGYYLIVWDFINWSKKNKIPVGPGRGSGAGSLAAYVLGITDIDPIKYDLLFERFLNPERESMPDFDIDFCVNGRERVIEYTRNKYGDDKVAQIITYGKLLGRGSVRDVGRVLDVPLPVVDKLAKMIPEVPGMTLNKALSKDPSLEKSFKEVEHGADILTHAKKLEGLIRNSGMHAAGIVIGDRPLEDIVPLCKGQKDEVVTQYEKDTCESVGLIKFDFLGLKNLTIIDVAVKNIKAVHGVELDIEKLPVDDKKSYELLQSGDTTGVFQLESGGMKNLLKKLKPTVFEDIIALVALYRPGPIGSGMLDSFVLRKHGEEEITYPVPELETILKETYGIIVYQEQVMQIARTMAGYSLGAADILRRAMGKKKKEVMELQKQIFLYGDEKQKIDGAIKKGYDEQKSIEIFNLIEKFAEYGFNKSHSAAYALIAYQTAYLKANYPVEYMAALLTCELDKGEKVVNFIEECKKMNISVLPPDINESNKDFTIVGGNIRFGLGALKNVGFGAIESIVEEREKDGEFKSIFEFCRRVDLRQANKKVLEALIKAGAFDCFGKNRHQLLKVMESAIENGQRRAKMSEQGIISVEDFLRDDDEEETDDETYPDVDEIPENELLQSEKEILGFYVSNHPLAKYSSIFEIFTTESDELNQITEEKEVIIGGIIKNVKHHITKKSGKRMAFLTLEDLKGEIDVVIFPDTYKENTRFFEEDKIIIIRGETSIKEEGVSVKGFEIFDVSDAVNKLTGGVKLKINTVGFTAERLRNLKQLIDDYKGDTPLILEVEKPAHYTVTIDLSEDSYIKPAYPFFKQIEEMFGEKRFEIVLKQLEKKEQNGYRKFYKGKPA